MGRKLSIVCFCFFSKKMVPSCSATNSERASPRPLTPPRRRKARVPQRSNFVTGSPCVYASFFCMCSGTTSSSLFSPSLGRLQKKSSSFHSCLCCTILFSCVHDLLPVFISKCRHKPTRCVLTSSGERNVSLFVKNKRLLVPKMFEVKL